MTSTQISVLCVDDNDHVGEALRIQMERSDRFIWVGQLDRADRLLDAVRDNAPHIVILDIDMPGKDPLVVLADIAEHFPDTRVIVFSGHIRAELVERAVEAGAWGYVSKSDGEAPLFTAIEQVHQGNFALSPEATAVLGESG